MQHIHILGICGTFMGSLAQLAKAKGYRVTGSDTHVYPPMSDQLRAAGIELIDGFSPAQLDHNPDLVVVGNVISRGNPVMEAILNRGIPFQSGPQWLAENILQGRWVLGVAGTHGKTTTSSMLAWILQFSGYQPGYLIGGVPLNFEFSAALGSSDFFVIEADEYDSAFFDKRSKFVHYGARTVILNNLEFDHADIFTDLHAIQTQFHHMIRTVPSEGLLIYPEGDEGIEEVLARGCWTPSQTVFGDWQADLIAADGSEFDVRFEGHCVGRIHWPMTGQHNVANGLAALAAARHVGVTPDLGCQALTQFKGVKRRMEKIGEVRDIEVFDDFAHHPTAIKTTLHGLRTRFPDCSLISVIEPRSNTMRMGVHKDKLIDASNDADRVIWVIPEASDWDLTMGVHGRTEHQRACTTDEAIQQVVQGAQRGDKIVIMSNGGFDGIHQRLLQALAVDHQ